MATSLMHSKMTTWDIQVPSVATTYLSFSAEGYYIFPPRPPGHRQVFHTLICLVWSPGRVMSVGYSLINTEWESRINASQCVCGVPRVFREILRRFREQDNNCSRHRWLEAHTCLGFPSCQVSCSTLESLFLGERERDSDLYLQMLQTSVLDFAVREYRLKARLRIKC